MAGDWIKMRTDLASNRFVIVMADSLRQSPDFRAWCCGQNPDKGVTQRAAIYVVVTALLKVWGEARAQGEIVSGKDGNEWKDILLKPSPLSAIDIASDLPGFGDAMVLAKWAEVEEGPAIRFPDAVRYIYSKDEVERMKEAKRKAKSREVVRDLSGECPPDVGHTIPKPIPNRTNRFNNPSPSLSAQANGSGDGVLKMQWGKTHSESDLMIDSKIDEMFGVVVANGIAHDTDEDRARFFGLMFYLRRQKSSNRVGLLTRILEGKARSKFHKSTDWRSRATDADLARAKQALRKLDEEDEA